MTPAPLTVAIVAAGVLVALLAAVLVWRQGSPPRPPSAPQPAHRPPTRRGAPPAPVALPDDAAALLARVTDAPTGPIPLPGRHARLGAPGEVSATGIMRAVRAEDDARPGLARPTRAQLRDAR